MLLNECPLRQRVYVTSVDCGSRYELRLGELGIRPGVQLIVTQKASFGGLVINVAGARLAVDHRSARQITVEAAL